MDLQLKQLTLGELAKVALGSTKLIKDHLEVLQILLRILMEKLNCQNEIVCISGFPGQCLKELLEKSQEPHIQVRCRNVESFHKKYILLDQLELRAQQIRMKLDNHYEDIRKLSGTKRFMPKFWDKYAMPTEDLCTLYSDGNKDFCIMARNTTFNRAMRSRMTEPVLKRMQEFEHQVDTMSVKLKDINVKADEVLDRLQLVGALIPLIEEIRQTINTQWLTVRQAMDEIQEMLACKLERITLPALKKYLERQFALANNHLLLFTKTDKQCRPPKVIDVVDKNVCLSCSQSEHIKPLPNLDLKLPCDKKCKCEVTSREATLLQKMDKIRVKSYRVTAPSVTSSINSFTESQTSSITQKLREQGLYVQSYTSYNKYRFRHDMDLKPLITVAEGANEKSVHRREKSFNPIKSLTFLTQGTRNSRAIPHLSISKMKSKLTINTRKHSNIAASGNHNRKQSKDFGRQRQDPSDNRPITISSVNFLYTFD